MSDEKSVAETLETIAEKISALGKSMDARFEQVDKRFEQVDKRFEQIDRRFEQIDKRFEQIDKRFEQIDKRFDELKAELRVEIEAVDGRVKLVYEAVVAGNATNATTEAEHATFNQRLGDHDIRILALERRRQNRG